MIETLEARTCPHPPATLRVAMRAGRREKRCGQVASYSIEPLEARVAPAAVITYTDLDGDLVRIIASKGPLALNKLTFVGGGTEGQLAKLDLTDAAFDGAKITFSVTRKPGGDGLAHVGFIDATGRDLDRVVVKGDLSKIVAGDATTANDPGLNLLQVRSIGTFGLLTQGGAGDLHSAITGKLRVLRVAGDFTDAILTVIGGVNDVDGQIGSIFIAGDVTGGASDDSGLISTGGAIGRVRIGGSVNGGAGNGSGQVSSVGQMGDVRVKGSISGAGGPDSGRIFSFDAIGAVRVGGGINGGAGSGSGQIFGLDTIGSVIVGNGVAGGPGPKSGSIRSNLEMGNVIVGDSVAGGPGNSSGQIFSFVSIGHVRIAGDLIGGSIRGSASLDESGLISSGGRIAGVTLGGSLIAGTNASTGTLALCGAIVAGDDIGPVKIGGILGNSSNPAVILAGGQAVKPTGGFDTAIASLTVKGNVRFAQILAGFDPGKNPINADAAIGAVNVGRNWVASSLVAGAINFGADDLPGGVGDNVNFGDVHDKLQTVGDTSLIARIASINIKGTVSGSLAPGDDHFGFVAQQIDKLTISGRTVSLGEGKDDLLLPFTNDVRVHEVS
jgi:hypothetical protein